MTRFDMPAVLFRLETYMEGPELHPVVAREAAAGDRRGHGQPSAVQQEHAQERAGAPMAWWAARKAPPSKGRQDWARSQVRACDWACLMDVG